MSSAHSAAIESVPSVDDLSISLIDQDIEFRDRLREKLEPEPPTLEDIEDVKVLAGSSFVQKQFHDE